jgi:hypothetical protein
MSKPVPVTCSSSEADPLSLSSPNLNFCSKKRTFMDLTGQAYLHQNRMAHLTKRGFIYGFS